MILEMAVLDLKNYFLFIAFTNFYPIIGICEIQLGKSLCVAKLI